MAEGRPDQNTRRAQGSKGQTVEAGLARQLSELAREMQAEVDMTALLRRITATAVYEVGAAVAAGISVIAGGQVRPEAATADLVRDLDQIQSDLAEGPCLSALSKQVTIRVDDYRDDQRWPKFAAAALERDIQSTLSVQLFVEADNLGALNLYAHDANAFTEHDETIAMLLASHAAVAMKGNSVQQNLRIALDSRDVIGQAKGILMERYKVDAMQAFDLLVLASQRSHIKLRDVADALTATGELKID